MRYRPNYCFASSGERSIAFLPENGRGITIYFNGSLHGVLYAQLSKGSYKIIMLNWWIGDLPVVTSLNSTAIYYLDSRW